MISKNFKVLEIRDDREYVFDSFAFKACVNKLVATKKANGEDFTKEKVKEALADKIYTSVDSVANWMYGKNGVSDLETVKSIAEYLEIDYFKLLREQEKKTMIEKKDINSFSQLNSNTTKDAIRHIYQKMAAFMDIAEDVVVFDSSYEVFTEYEPYFKEAKSALHQGMLDIPAKLYKELEAVLDTLEVYMYGYDCGTRDIWEGEDYLTFIKDATLKDNSFAQIEYMENESDKFYKKMREILKDYITE